MTHTHDKHQSICLASVLRGATSDFVALFYRHCHDGLVAPAVLHAATPPLEELLSSRDSCSALLWDTGYALALDIYGKTRLVKIRVKCGLSMADIAVNAAYYESIGCTWDDCSTTNTTINATTYSYRAPPRSCQMEQVQRVALCAAEGTSVISISEDDALSSLWAIGNLSSVTRDTVLGMRVTRHSLTNGTTMYAIRADEREVVDASKCPARPSLVIPCIPYEQVVSQQNEWCRPVQSDLVTAWIVVEERQQLALINLIVLAGAVLLAVAMDLFIDRKPRMFRSAAIAAAVPSLDSADMDLTEQSVHPNVVSGWSSARSTVE
ncbi:hypothetical protein FI667_g10887, partial [Globisporangium splendens]